MNKEYAQGALAEIEKATSSPEQAHRLEDALRDDFIEFVAKQDGELGELAQLVLSTNEIKFIRWYA